VLNNINGSSNDAREANFALIEGEFAPEVSFKVYFIGVQYDLDGIGGTGV